MKAFNRNIVSVYNTIIIIIVIMSCSDQSSNDSNLDHLSGVWELSATLTSNTCAQNNGDSSSERIILIQCEDEISIIRGSGPWGNGRLNGDNFEFTGYEIQVDSNGGNTIYNTSGILNGSEKFLEGTFTTNISSSSPEQSECSIVTEATLSLVSNYENNCIDRDIFTDPAESDYILPWPKDSAYVISNSYCIPTGGHRQQMAYDFLIPINDPVVAARGGVVRQLKESSPDDGQGSDHNHVMIEHNDGTVGFYAHLKQWSVSVYVGENVAAGQTIAAAGHSGTTDIVHLHFGVYSSWPPLEGNDVAVNFRNADGLLD